MSDTKQVIIVRKDLNMRKGKIAAQSAHAAMAFITRRMATLNSNVRTGFYAIKFTEPEQEWLESSFTKVCVYVNSEEELLAINAAAIEAGLESHTVIDSGKTEFNGVPTMTCLAIGPDYVDKIDKITGHLPLL